MIPVTKTYIPCVKKYNTYIERIFDSGWLTNNGSLLQLLEQRLAKYLGVKHLICVANGSIALQLAYKVLNLKGEVITTPFSFAATTSTLSWEGLTPRFSDINPKTFNIDPVHIERLINKNTSAIVPVHVYGNPCDVEELAAIASKRNIKIIYDAAHCFGVQYMSRKKRNESLLNYGDISTISFHSTKLFHTVEGGALITNDDSLAEKIRLMINFGLNKSNEIITVGTNAKMNEFEAAMGLCVLDEIDNIRSKRKIIWNNYKRKLNGYVEFQEWNENSKNNFSYAPVLLSSEKVLKEVQCELKLKNIFTRRYFFPSLDRLDYLNNNDTCPTSNNIASRILCLPLYPELKMENQEEIIKIIIKTIERYESQ